MFCGNCGAKFEADAKFCVSCGQAVHSGAAAAAVAAVTPLEEATVVRPISGYDLGAPVKLPSAGMTPAPALPRPRNDGTPATYVPPPVPASTTGSGEPLRIVCGVMALLVAVFWACSDWVGPGQRDWAWGSLYEAPAQLLLVAAAILMLLRRPFGAAYVGVASTAVGLTTVLLASLPIYRRYGFQGTPLGHLPDAAILVCGLIALAVGIAALVSSRRPGRESVPRESGVLVAAGLLLEYAGVLVVRVATVQGYASGGWHLAMIAVSVVDAMLAAAAMVGAIAAHRSGSGSGAMLAVVCSGATIITCPVAYWAMVKSYSGSAGFSDTLQGMLLEVVWPVVATIVLALSARSAQQQPVNVGPTPQPRVVGQQRSAAAGQQPTSYAAGTTLPSGALTFWITFFFGVFGLIPATMHSNRAAAAGQSGSRYWKAFWYGVLATFLVWLALLAVLWVFLNSLAASISPGT